MGRSQQAGRSEIIPYRVRGLRFQDRLLSRSRRVRVRLHGRRSVGFFQNLPWRVSQIHDKQGNVAFRDGQDGLDDKEKEIHAPVVQQVTKS